MKVMYYMNVELLSMNILAGPEPCPSLMMRW
jgi:hypothetical protein